MNVTLMHVLYKEVWIIEVCGAAEGCAVSLHHNLVPSLLLGLVFVQPNNQPAQETALAPKQRIINIKLNLLILIKMAAEPSKLSWCQHKRERMQTCRLGRKRKDKH